MGIKAGIRSLLVNDATLASYVGTRVSPVVSHTESQLPRIIYNRTDSDNVEHLSGVASLRYDTFQIVSVSNSIDEADAIALRVQQVLEGVQNQTVGDVRIQRCFHEGFGENSWYPEGREKPIYEVEHTFEVAYFAS